MVARVAPHQGHRCSPVQSSLRVDVSLESLLTLAVLSLFCQLSHGILPTAPATAVLRQCPQQQALMVTLWHPPSWRVATLRRAPGLAPGAMKAGGTCHLRCHLTSPSMRCTLALAAITASSQVSSSLLCRETGQRQCRCRALIRAPQACLTRPATQRTGRSRSQNKALAAIVAQRGGTESLMLHAIC